MQGRRRRSGARHQARGFTLVELLIAVLVVAVLAAIALPSYENSMRKSRRSEAFAALSNVQQMQERHRSSHAQYAASLTAAPTATPPGLGMAGTRTGNGYYDLAVSLIGTGETGYTLTAEAVAGSPQAKDGACKVLAVRMNGGNLVHGSAATVAAIDWTQNNPDAARCWAR